MWQVFELERRVSTGMWGRLRARCSKFEILLYALVMSDT